jgi:hypothetical protein
MTELNTESPLDLTETPKDLEQQSIPKGLSPMSPEARVALRDLMALEDRRQNILNHSTNQAKEASGLDFEVDAAETALKRSKAASIVDPNSDNAAAVDSAHGHVEDLASQRKRYAEAADALTAEAALLVPEIDKVRAEAFELSLSELTGRAGDGVKQNDTE